MRAKRILSWGLLAASIATGCAKTQPSDSEAFIRWASAHVIATESPGYSFAEPEIATFREAIGSARVVGIGESRHDTREQLLLKGVLVRHLIEELGFRALILEESFPHAEALDQYVTTGKGDLQDLMNQLAGWYLWDTEEMLELVQWIRQFNSEREPARQVRVYGMDITAPALGVQAAIDALQLAGVDSRVDAQALGLDLQEGDFWPRTWERYAALSNERREELGGNYEQLNETLAGERRRLVAAFSEDEFERTLLMGRIGSMGNEFFSSASREQGGEVRERGMAQVVQWVLDRERTGAKAIIWAHNLHVAKSPFRMPGFAEGELIPLGVHLHAALGDAYLAIGGTFGAGAYPADLPPGERSFEVPSADVMDGALARIGTPCLLVDLRGVEQDSAPARWLRQDREWRAQDSSSVLVPIAAFDLVYFVSEISRSQPTPLALQRFQSLGN